MTQAVYKFETWVPTTPETIRGWKFIVNIYTYGDNFEQLCNNVQFLYTDEEGCELEVQDRTLTATEKANLMRYYMRQEDANAGQ